MKLKTLKFITQVNNYFRAPHLSMLCLLLYVLLKIQWQGPLNVSKSELHIGLHSTSKEIKKASNKTFKILFATKSYEKGGNWFGLGSEPFQNCHYSNCFTTNNLKRDLANSDAVLFFQMYTFLEELPQRDQKLTNQKWILFNMECPARAELYRQNSQHEYKGRNYDGVFNVTMSYHKEADLQYTYSHMRGKQFFKKADHKITNQKTNFAAGKTKMVAWFVSNCGKWREKYVNKLQTYISVDIYGQCGSLQCPRNTSYANMTNDSCNAMMGRDYKFYLAFESHLCEDYYTEKLWKPILFKTIPIVMGASDYSDILPPHSYIDIKDFKSPKHLAHYLKELDSNDELYNSYFKWHEEYDLKSYPPLQCFLCEYLNINEKRTSTHLDMDTYWTVNENCFNPQQYYKYIEPETWDDFHLSINSLSKYI